MVCRDAAEVNLLKKRKGRSDCRTDVGQGNAETRHFVIYRLVVVLQCSTHCVLHVVQCTMYLVLVFTVIHNRDRVFTLDIADLRYFTRLDMIFSPLHAKMGGMSERCLVFTIAS